jgi:hypothetical protein
MPFPFPAGTQLTPQQIQALAAQNVGQQLQAQAQNQNPWGGQGQGR